MKQTIGLWGSGRQGSRVRQQAWVCRALLVGTLCVGGCKKDAPEGKADEAGSADKKVEQVVASAQPAEGEASKKLSELQKQEEQLQRVKQALSDLEKDIAAEKERWTPELTKKAQALVAEDYASAGDAIRAAVESPHRKPENRERDAYRHPLQTLQFFELEPTSHVVEMGAGGGWYTEILAPIVAKHGSLTIGSFDEKGPEDSMLTVYGRRQSAMLGMSPDLYGKVKRFQLKDQVELGQPGSADLVLAIREMHNWQRFGRMDDYLKAVHEVLEPGGTFGVVQHRAPAGAKPEDSAPKGYLDEGWLIGKVESAGFRLAGKSEVNANPKDTKDYEGGVWTLPPNLRGNEADKEKYQAIGESDRMTLRFTKTES